MNALAGPAAGPSAGSGRIGSAAALALLLGAGPAPAPPSARAPALDPDLPAAVARIQEGLASRRGLEPPAAVAVESLPPGAVRAYLRAKLHEEYPAGAIAAEQAAYLHFGFLRPGDDLESLFLDLLSDQAAGFYDTDSKALYLVPGRSIAGEALVHELVHAMQDHAFDVERILREARPDDDRLLAAQAMIEGEAMAMTDSYCADHPDLTGPFAARGPSGGEEEAERAPRRSPSPSVLQESLMFGYTYGRTWADATMGAGGRALMDAMFRSPPDSTEQILHPEKSLHPRDLPSIVERGLLDDPGTPGLRRVKTNSMGEFQIRLLLGGAADQGAADAAAGWDGDLYAIDEGPGGAKTLTWVSVWDSGGDAASFRSAAAAWLAARHPGPAGYRAALAGPGGRFVVILEGPDEARAAEVERRLRARIDGGSGGALR